MTEIRSQITLAANETLGNAKIPVAFLAEHGGFEKASVNDEEMITTLAVHNQIADMLGITRLSSEIRSSLLSNDDTRDSTNVLLGDRPYILEKLAEVQTKAELLSLLTQEGNEQERLSDQADAWKTTIAEVAESLCVTPDDRDHYASRLEIWKDRLMHSSSNGTSEKPSYQDRLQQLLGKERAIQLLTFATRPERGEELAEELMDTFLENAWAINAIKVLKIIRDPLSIKAQAEKLLHHLDGKEQSDDYNSLSQDKNLRTQYRKFKKQRAAIAEDMSLKGNKRNELVEELTAAFVQEIQPFLEKYDLTDVEETVDLDVVRASVKKLQEEAARIKSTGADNEENQRQLFELDSQLQTLLIPIFNKIAAAFPQEGMKHASSLKDVLENQTAVCAGKTNIALVVAQYLGLGARAVFPIKRVDDGYGTHIFVEYDLFSDAKLEVDINFTNYTHLRGVSKRKLEMFTRWNSPNYDNEEEFAERVKYYSDVAIPNSYFIPGGSRILLYTVQRTSETSRELHADPADYQTVRINPRTNKLEIWKANIPIPHRIVAPDRSDEFVANSSILNNLGVRFLYSSEHGRIAAYMLQKAIRLSPFDSSLYGKYARVVDNEQAIVYLQNLKITSPEVFWFDESTYGPFNILTEKYLQAKKYDELLAFFDKVKTEDIHLYYTRLYVLGNPFFLNSPWKEMRKEYLLNAKNEHPELFFADGRNVQAVNFNNRDYRECIDILLEYKRYNPEEFWTHSKNKHFRGYERLLNLAKQEKDLDLVKSIEVEAVGRGMILSSS